MIRRISLNKTFQNFILKTKDKKFLEKIDRNLPIYEALFATTIYLASNELNTKIPKERKSSLNWQTAIGGFTGATIAKSLDSWANKHKNKICEELKRLNIKNSEKLLTGTRIAVPLIITSFTTRYLMSTLSVPLSIMVAKLQRDSKNKKILDIKA